ncbi:hypothetical protein [Pseudonocardia charpentierae]|uniref:PQQ-like domain-containing protein n=1 Tax=Pseudonocardia charpentierae TaxID=3075545 RepID=A0ABU2NE83_9PSEU|nr:hypothetical protein [Pseudonocardia sp. DSM 45834]MDT0351569.1 hypothetical protein [Pseudonocardia sp. DSM 45834]
MTTSDARRPVLPVAVPVAFAVTAAGAALLPWWRADRGAVLLGAGPLRELPPDTWTGVAVSGWWTAAIAVPAGVAVVAAALAFGRSARARQFSDAARWAAAVAGLAAVALAVHALAGWGTSGAPGAWVALAAGLASVATTSGELRVPARRVARSCPSSRASRRTTFRVGAAVAVVATVAVPLVVAPTGTAASGRDAVGPFVPVAAVGAFPLRSGEAGLAASDDPRPVVADGAPGVVSRAGVVVTGAHGRARVLARSDRGAPAPIGVVGDRVVRWISSDAVAVTELRVGSTVDVVVRGVSEAGPLGADGSVWLRTDADPLGTVRRLDVAGLDGEQRLAATYLPVVTIQEPVPPVDVRSVLPVRGGGLRTVGGDQLEMLTGTASGIATTPLAGSRCGTAGTAGLAMAAPDGTGLWFVLHGRDGARLALLDPAARAAVRVVPTVLPGDVTGLVAPGDGSVLFVAQDPRGATLWRLGDAKAALAGLAEPPVSCPPTF